jgi:hypothetical protein
MLQLQHPQSKPVADSGGNNESHIPPVAVMPADLLNRFAGRQKCYATLMVDLTRELNAMKEDFTSRSIHGVDQF